MSEHKSSRSRKPLVIGVTLGCVLIALCAAGLAYALHYSARALPNVSVAGQSVSGMTRDEIAQMVDQRAKAMQVNVVVEGHSTPLTLSDMGITVDPQGSADKRLPRIRTCLIGSRRFSFTMTYQLPSLSMI